MPAFLQRRESNHHSHYLCGWNPFLWPLKSLYWESQGCLYEKVGMLQSWGSKRIPLNEHSLRWLLSSYRPARTPQESACVLQNNQCKASLHTLTSRLSAWEEYSPNQSGTSDTIPDGYRLVIIFYARNSPRHSVCSIADGTTISQFDARALR